MDADGIVRRGWLAFGLGCLAVLLMTLISEGAHWQSSRTLSRLDAMAQVPVSLQDLQWSLLDAVAARHDAPDAGPALRARTEVGLALASLDAHYRDRPEAQSALAALHAEVAERLRALQAGAGGPPGAAGAAGGAEDLRAVAGVRAVSNALLELESASVAQARNDLARTLALGRVGVVALSLLSLLGLGLYLRQNLALKRQQQGLQRLLQAEHDGLEREVAQRTAQLTELALHLQTAREDERSRLARDLHDELGALLTSAKLDAARIKARLGEGAPEALERLAHLVLMLNSGIALKRRIIEDLRPSALGTLGLVATLEILGREFADRAGIEVCCTLAPVALDPGGDLIAYRVVQEAITNISKYAQARHVWIDLAQQDGRVEVAVRDDGVGFDSGAPAQSAYGLVGMRFRVQAARGQLSVVSAPGQGTHIRASLPATAAAPG
ncbi:MAG: sensor histidine kinase [Burkholderiales bacterium]|nr:sensor histidine kinase [Burkholderiales bacterium]